MHAWAGTSLHAPNLGCALPRGASVPHLCLGAAEEAVGTGRAQEEAKALLGFTLLIWPADSKKN
jgi:hypothetical protein